MTHLNPNDFDFPRVTSDEKSDFRNFLLSRLTQNDRCSGLKHELAMVHCQNWAGASETTKFFHEFRKHHQFEGNFESIF